MKVREQATYRIQIGQDGDDKQWDSVEETDSTQPNKTQSFLPGKFSVRGVHVSPDLHKGSVVVHGKHMMITKRTMSLGLGANSISVPLGCLPAIILATM